MLLKKTTKGLRRQLWQFWNPHKPWHMRPYDPRFAIQRSPGETRIFWSGRHVASSVCASQVQRVNNASAIVASGPTLIETPAAAWLNSDIVCVNGSIMWAQERGIRPLLHIVTDGGFVRRRLELVRLAAELSGTICLSIRCVFEALKQDPTVFLGRRLFMFENANQPYGRAVYTRQELAANPLVKVDPHRMFEARYIGISRDPEFGFFPGGTVVIGAAQVALSLGYRDLQFLGLDMKRGRTSKRFYREERPEPSFIDRNFERLILPSFEILRSVCDENDVTLSNWSFDSAVPRHLVPLAGAACGMARSA